MLSDLELEHLQDSMAEARVTTITFDSGVVFNRADVTDPKNTKWVVKFPNGRATTFNNFIDAWGKLSSLIDLFNQI